MRTGGSRSLVAESGTFAGNARFEIVRELGSGATGTVHEAIDRVRGARVALKTLRAFTPERLLLLKHEFRALAGLHHPNLVTLDELFDDAGQWFFTMELVPGSDLVSYVRPGDDGPIGAPTDPLSMESGELRRPARSTEPRGSFDEGRLRASLAQLAAAIGALHAAGKVHLDVKSSNVRVTPDGRVVLLDFGLVREAGAPGGDGARPPLGTPTYMAPEIAIGGAVGPAADWYSFGVVLYRCLTGGFPHEGPPMEVLRAKQYVDPEPVESIEPAAPADLAALCRALLSRDPRARPSDGEVLAKLDVRGSGGATRSGTLAFVGRADELATLDGALEAAKRGAGASVVVRGESGIGKTALVQRFLDGASAKDRDVLVLAGRCHERESVPYQAFDGIVDALARHLAQLAPHEIAEVLPAGAGLLAHLFPALLHVRSIADAAPPGAPAGELRAQAFAAIRETLIALARRRRVILAIDDLQWADADGLALITTVLRAPAPPLLFVATERTSDGRAGASRIGERLGARSVDLAPLPDADARELATRLGEELEGGRAIEAGRVVREAHGLPLFIQEIVRAAATTGAPRDMPITEAYTRRLEQLGATERALVDDLAIAARPLPADLLSRALGVGWERFVRDVAALRAAHLVRDTRAHGGPAIELFHDRVRQAALGVASAETCRARHRALAAAYEEARPGELDALVTHWLGAGEPTRAAKHALGAAERAERTLAFDRAAALYRIAMGAPDVGREQRHSLLVRMAHALSDCGRGVEAADAYLDAAGHAAADEQIDLRRRAAEQLLVVGQVDRGVEILDTVLAASGLRMPRSRAAATARIAIALARLFLRGADFEEHAESEIPPDVLRRIDVCWSAFRGLLLHEIPAGAAFAAEFALLALDAGEPRRAAHAILFQASFLTSTGEGGKAKARELIARVGQMADRLGDSALHAGIETVHALQALHAGRWDEAYAHAQRHVALVSASPDAGSWEIESVLRPGAMALYLRGRLLEVEALCEERIPRAIDRGDRLAASAYRTDVFVAIPLMHDDPDRARERAQRSLDGWTTRGFAFQHWHAAYAEAQADLYAGRAPSALALLRRVWKPLDQSGITLQPYFRICAFDLRARAALACGELRDARSFGRQLGKRKEAWGRALGALVEARVARAEGARDVVLLHRRAVTALEEAKMDLHAAVARARLGELLKGDEAEEGRACAARATGYFASQHVVRAERFVAMLAP